AWECEGELGVADAVRCDLVRADERFALAEPRDLDGQIAEKLEQERFLGAAVEITRDDDFAIGASSRREHRIVGPWIASKIRPIASCPAEIPACTSETVREVGIAMDGVGKDGAGVIRTADQAFDAKLIVGNDIARARLDAADANMKDIL